MSEIHIHRIKTFLLQEFAELIDVSDVNTGAKNLVEQHLLTRAQAALALSYAADIPADEAAPTIVDGFEDNGIDAIYHDKDSGVLHIVQSKWVAKGNKTIDLGSVNKFVRGVEDLLSVKFDRFNKKVLARSREIEAALEDGNVLISLVIAYTGSQMLPVHATQALDDLLTKINDVSEVLSYRIYTQKDLYLAISGGLQGRPIDINVTLYDWGKISEPYRAFYGRVPAVEIAEWYVNHESRLFARNLRKFKGDTEVNRQIRTTLIGEPEKFWYFNNGITVLCNRISQSPLRATSRDAGHFHCKGISVVNGAQTVGNIATSIKQGFAQAQQAYVLVRFISLEDCPPDFATEVTTATNTQNRIEPRDFASLDPTQERLKQDLSLDLNKIYAYKSGEKDPLPDYGCTIEEATIALACANPNIQLAAQAKSALSKLWEDISRPPYTLIFNERLTAVRMWNSVQVLHVVDAILEHERLRNDGRVRQIAIHGNRFILHRVFQSLPLDQLDDATLDQSALRQQATEETKKALQESTEAASQHFTDSYINVFFKSSKKCAEMFSFMPPLREHPEIPYFQMAPEWKQTTLFDG